MGCLLALGLLALHWFQPGFFIKTEDVALPFTPQRWHQYTYAWNNLIDMGIQFWENFSALISLSLPAALQGLGISMLTTQRLEYLVWFTLPGLSMYSLMCYLAPGPSGRVSRLVASTFYMCNLYLEPVWQGFNIANLSAYVTLPVLLALFMWGWKRHGDWRAIPLMALVSLLGAGVGTNPPLMIVSAIPLPLYVLGDILGHRRWRQPQELRRLLGYLGVALVAMAAVNAFWLLPQLEMMRGGGMASAVDQATSSGVSDAWLKGVSAETSFLNVLRLQGHWVWHEGWGEPYVPYASTFQNNPWILWLSFLLPAVIWAGLLGKMKPLEFFFATLAVIGLWFGIGIHPPFGTLYVWMVKHVPLFWIIRSPWYKFTLLTCLGYAVLLGQYTGRLQRWVLQRLARHPRRYVSMTLVATAIPLGVMALTLAYAFPVSLGKMYPTAKERHWLAPSHVQIPSYVYQAAHWVNGHPDIHRILVLPGRRVYATLWGYTDYMPALTYFTSKALVFDYPRSGWATGETSQILDVVKQSLRDGITRNLHELLASLNVDTILVEHDAATLFHIDPADYPVQLARRLKDQLEIVPSKTFGPWEFYRVQHRLPLFTLASHVTLVLGTEEAFATLANTNLVTSGTLLFATQQTPETMRWLFQHRLIHRVVSWNASPAELRAVLSHHPHQDIDLFYTSNQMETVFHQKPLVGLRLQALQGFSPPEVFQGHEWRWLLTNNQPNILIENVTDKPHYGNAGFSVYGFGRLRSLYTYLNGELASLQPIPANKAVDIRLPRLQFKPGLNTLAFYAPEQHDIRKGRAVNFALRDMIVDTPILAQMVDLPLTGSYRMWWYLEGPIEQSLKQFAESVGIDGQAISLTREMVGGRPAFVSEPMELSAGKHRIWCEPLIGTRLALRLSLGQISSTEATEPSVGSVTAHALQPAQYVVSYQTVHPALLVFHAGFHPGWILRVAGRKPRVPVVVNGFSNGYLLEANERAEGTLEFTPQRLFVIGSIVSGVSVLASILVLGWFYIHRRPQGFPPCR